MNTATINFHGLILRVVYCPAVYEAPSQDCPGVDDEAYVEEVYLVSHMPMHDTNITRWLNEMALCKIIDHVLSEQADRRAGV
jgi:hypothetical protein